MLNADEVIAFKAHKVCQLNLPAHVTKAHLPDGVDEGIWNVQEESFSAGKSSIPPETVALS